MTFRGPGLRSVRDVDDCTPGSVQPEGLIQRDDEASNSLNSSCVRPRLIQAASRPIRIPARRLVMPRLHRGGRAPWFSCWHRGAGGPSSGFIGAAASLKSVGDSHRCRRGSRRSLCSSFCWHGLFSLGASWLPTSHAAGTCALKAPRWRTANSVARGTSVSQNYSGNNGSSLFTVFELC